MKKLIGIFLASILLVGCQEAQIKEETIDEPYVDKRPLYVSNAKPRGMDGYQQFGNDATSVSTAIVRYCWGKELSDCPTELTKSPEEALNGGSKQKVSPEFPMLLQIDIDPSNPLPFPDRGELYLYEDDEYKPVEVKDNYFELPEKEGIYVYVYKTIYDSDHKGTTFYAFDVNVRK